MCTSLPQERHLLYSVKYTLYNSCLEPFELSVYQTDKWPKSPHPTVQWHQLPLFQGIQQRDSKRETLEVQGTARGKSPTGILFKTSSFLQPVTKAAYGIQKALGSHIALQKGWYGERLSNQKARRGRNGMWVCWDSFPFNTSPISLILSHLTQASFLLFSLWCLRSTRAVWRVLGCVLLGLRE